MKDPKKLNMYYNMLTRTCDELQVKMNEATRTLNDMAEDAPLRSAFESYADKLGEDSDRLILRQRAAGEALQMAEQIESELAA
jgi:hypothetical protein